jgi:uncharacterized protein with HEPN domain
MPSDRRAQRLRDVILNCEKILRHTAGMDFDRYLADDKTIDAVERCLARISEACYKLGPAIEPLAPEVPWRGARGIGNILRHDYDQIDHRIIWETIQRDIPALLAGARYVLNQL